MSTTSFLGVPVGEERRGQVLIEALVAISILTIGFLGVIALLNNSLSLNRVVADNYTATYLAAEGIEVTKNLLDTNLNNNVVPWYQGFAGGEYELQYNTDWDTPGNQPVLSMNRPLLFDPSTGIYSYDASADSVTTAFYRTVTVNIISPVEVQVISKVNWISRGGVAYSVVLEDHFFNWQY